MKADKKPRDGVLLRLVRQVRRALGRPVLAELMIEPDTEALDAWRALLGART